jgi:6-phosphofructokinase
MRCARGGDGLIAHRGSKLAQKQTDPFLQRGGEILATFDCTPNRERGRLLVVIIINKT